MSQINSYNFFNFTDINSNNKPCVSVSLSVIIIFFFIKFVTHNYE